MVAYNFLHGSFQVISTQSLNINFHVFILHLFNKENNVGYSKLSADHYSASLFFQGDTRPVHAVRVYFVIMTSIIYWLWSII